MSNHRKTCLMLCGLMFFLLIPSVTNAFSLNSLFGIFKSNHDKPAAKRHAAHHSPVNSAKANKTEPPAHIKVGVYVLHVGRYDLQSASVRMDFYLIFKCDSACKNLNFEIMNATDANIHLVDKEPNILVYRVQADLNKADNLRSYPFDSHSLDIIVENRQTTNDKLTFEADPSTTAFDEDLCLVGFKLLPIWKAQVTTHFYRVFQQSYSCYKFSMFIVRPLLAGFLKGILPALIIICCSFLALILKIDHSAQRLGVATSTLISAEVFHLNLTASLPPLGYTTYADMFMLINYLCLLAVLIEVVTVTYFIEIKRSVAVWVNRTCAILIPTLWIALQIIIWFSFNPGNIVK